MLLKQSNLQSRERLPLKHIVLDKAVLKTLTLYGCGIVAKTHKWLLVKPSKERTMNCYLCALEGTFPQVSPPKSAQ